ncbi:unnamed protein product [Paramecium sonneborni]|uniref:Uncharacterized protein n=1 Tax=Paramecium sonneborni TaxID=65129 RepID=A0A8S1KNF6_9CILI|nr:unnamed protein product [Paramecium sonneborni]
MSEIYEEDLEQQITLSKKDANQLRSSLESIYIVLQMKGKYLPKYTSSIITADYLLTVLFENVFVLNVKQEFCSKQQRKQISLKIFQKQNQKMAKIGNLIQNIYQINHGVQIYQKPLTSTIIYSKIITKNNLIFKILQPNK